MLDKTKYIVYETPSGMIIANIFPPYIKHSDMAEKLCSNCKIIGAGFCDIYPKNNKIYISCFGKSVSLKVQSNCHNDGVVIKDSLFGDSEEVIAT